ncbi:hypothetical protein OPT61_g8982 [Boeremia exigua]|uniref:Uncharacterized protein n=1 Tax=Boeremia exigua TaxID=749465 RepID=A0ACC2HWN4_9PLEO|nr:hypothetical protein OPT61_g8982 [Boeremia exigua]
MPLWTTLSTFKAALAPENKDASIAQRFASWEQGVTTDEIQKAFLSSLTEGDEDLHVDITAKELERFNAICSACQSRAEGQLDISSIVQYLVQAHDNKNEVLQLNKQNLENLVISHASFPFSTPTPLTSDAFCRSGILLIERCDSIFKQAISIGEHYVIRARSPSARLNFIFSSLTHPPTGAPTHDDMLDVLCRVRYPVRIAAKGQFMRKPVEQLLPLAHRLEPLKQLPPPGKSSSTNMQQLGQLVRAFPSPYKHLITDTDVEMGGDVNAEQFVKWALEVRLLDTLDQVFGVFFAERQH